MSIYCSLIVVRIDKADLAGPETDVHICTNTVKIWWNLYGTTWNVASMYMTLACNSRCSWSSVAKRRAHQYATHHGRRPMFPMSELACCATPCRNQSIEILQTHALPQILFLHFSPLAMLCRYFNSRIFQPCNFDRAAFSTPAFLAQPYIFSK